jgi:hypothetical protein|tara:strand:- start:4 stop:297 length:294 start_codon:yes stop_codon:yes gene_type:complete
MIKGRNLGRKKTYAQKNKPAIERAVEEAMMEDTGRVVSDTDQEIMRQMYIQKKERDRKMEEKEFGIPSMMNMGGEVRGYKMGGAVMAGRGGKYKGTK